MCHTCTTPLTNLNRKISPQHGTLNDKVGESLLWGYSSGIGGSEVLQPISLGASPAVACFCGGHGLGTCTPGSALDFSRVAKARLRRTSTSSR